MVGWLGFSDFTAIIEIPKCICICGILLHSGGSLRGECNKKMWHFFANKSLLWKDVPISLLVMLLIHMFFGLSRIISDRFSDLLLQELWEKSALGRLYAFLSPFWLDDWNSLTLQLSERSPNVSAFAEFLCILKVPLERNVTKKCGTSLQRRAFSSIDIFESLLKGKFAMELLCKSEVVIEDCFGTFHKEINFAYAWN